MVILFISVFIFIYITEPKMLFVLGKACIVLALKRSEIEHISNHTLVLRLTKGVTQVTCHLVAALQGWVVAK